MTEVETPEIPEATRPQGLVFEGLWTICHGKNELILPTLADASVDAVICDPPAGIGFMGKTWDKPGVLGVSGGKAMPATTSSRNPMCRSCGKHKRGKDKCSCEAPDFDEVEKHVADRELFVQWLTGVMRETARVLKPGGHMLVWALPRTSSWTARAIEDAGLTIRDVLVHLSGQGFPKNLDVSKAIDKGAYAEPLWDDIRAHIRRWRDERKFTNASLNEALGVASNGSGMTGHWTSEKEHQEIPSKAQWMKLRALLEWPPCTLDEMYAAVKDGAARPVVGRRHGIVGGGFGAPGHGLGSSSDAVEVTAPATDAATRWSGWGTALKPSSEHWILARKPMTGTVASNVLKHGTGALNIDGSRVFTDWSERSEAWKHSGHSAKPDAEKIAAPAGDGIHCHPAGRWPPNVLLSHAAPCRPVGQRKITAASPPGPAHGPRGLGPCGDAKSGLIGNGSRGSHGTETIEAWECLAACSCGLTTRFPAGAEPPACECGEAMFWACPVAELDRQSGTKVGSNGRRAEQAVFVGYSGQSKGTTSAVEKSSGGASRIFPTFSYHPKASKADRNDGLGGEKNSHATVKGQSLMKWLCRLITPPGGIILDPFTGSGSTGVAALACGFRFIGIEKDPVHVEEARARVAQAELDLKEERSGQALLFGRDAASEVRR